MAAPSEYALEPLREGPDFTLYRGWQHGNPSPVLVAALTAGQPSPQGLRRLEHEYSLAAKLEPAWAATPLTLTRHEGRTILVLKDPGGKPLDLVLERDQGRPLDLARVLHIAVGLAVALGQVHRRGLIHKDIKPANVLVEDNGSVWLTGFGIASQLPHERQSPVPIEIIAGTLAYMAPEQTGRMNRSIDTRSDLYSLGVTLYQMLTGTLPFAAADPLEWVHCHIARQPAPPGDRAAVPEPLSAIVMKLLAKNAEERYQTASGLEADLRQCRAEWESHGRIDLFPLGAHDSSDRLLIPEKLYGREHTIGVLLAAFNRVVAEGTPELVLVSGYSGVGKSSVVNELHKVLVPPRGLFASGKFDQYKRDIPYATLAEAFQALTRQILVKKNEAEVCHWRHTLQEALGANGQLIINLIPEVEFLIGKQLPVPDLPPQDARKRFQLVFRRFFSTFARPEHPLALFLDDLQWLDAATLELLEYLITDPDLGNLMLVGAYRDNEVSSSHPLTHTLAAIRKAGLAIQELVLEPLGIDDVGRLVADALHCEADSGHLLAKLVHEKTGGNPFFAIQLLTALAEEGLLRRDPCAGAWIWDLACIRAHGYTNNVVDLMVEKLKRLSGRTQTALQTLACLGHVVEFTTLTRVFRKSEEEIHISLLEPVRAGLILCLEGSYAFLHDRIQEAAYALIPDGDRAGAHLGIGRVLLAAMSEEQLAEQPFDVANQFNRGAVLLVDWNEKAEAAAINLRAGRKAKASTAYASAREYFSLGMALLESDWSSQHELMFSLCLERAECEFLTGNIDTAEQLIGELLQHGISKIDQAAAYNLKALLQVMKSETKQALDSALTSLRGIHHLRAERVSTSTPVTIGASVGQLDVATVVKASQALSSEILLPKLIEKLLRIALEHAGAERGLLILLRGDEPQIEAEATTDQGRVEVTVRRAAITPYDLPQAALHYVIRTGERVVLDDPSTATLYSKDEYVRTKRTLSVLCLPIVKQTKLIGALYLENTLTPRAYTPDRVAVLEMLVSQATISLENATLFSDLHRSEAYLAEGQSISHTGSFGWNVLSGEIYWSEETYKIFEYDRSVKPTLEAVLHRIHPDDRDRWRESIDRMTHQRTDYEIDYRLLIPDGSVKYLHVATRALENSSGDLEFVGTATDVTAAKQAEDKIRQSEMELRQILEFTPQQIAVLGPDGTPIYSNQANLDYYGFTLQEWQSYDHRRFVHPDDFEQTMRQYYSKFLSGLPYEVELRLRGADGRYRWFLVRHNPLQDAEGHLLRWYITGTDIEDRKQAEKRLQNENVALREEVDRASMFEEIVGGSPALRAVLARVSKVAPTDSTVLITGETGTGKELIARAVHKRSKRSSQAFVSVNCAAIPRDLIASELFGHEKGAFTGAVQRRLGRFELAEGGTIFLDEIGELPTETQIALLRVLQEREFERVGGTVSIRTNVRLIAATNRDLQAAISASAFRRDLFYRLNVFPIEVPPLRERREDILVLVEYFIDRFARKAGKNFRCVDKQSLELLQSYPWPGNIRELQNIIERSVIVCDTENFSVDERWLSRQPHAREPKSQPKFSQKLASREKEMIEEALRESGGRVSGPSGAAAKLGLPGSTLDSKIRSLKIDKNRFKSIQPSTDRT